MRAALERLGECTLFILALPFIVLFGIGCMCTTFLYKIGLWKK